MFVSRRVWWFAVWDVVFVWVECRYNTCSTCSMLLLHSLVVGSCFFYLNCVFSLICEGDEQFGVFSQWVGFGGL